MSDAVEAPALRVKRGDGETIRRRLLDEGRLRVDLKIRGEGGDLLLPLDGDDGATERARFETQPRPAPPYAEVARVPPALKPLLPAGFDVIGSVVVVKLPKELLPYQREVGEALLTSVKPARTVAVDRGVKGEYRVRDVEVVAGDPTTETEIVENGVRLLVDVATCYVSPRLAFERRRVAELVRSGERVLDLFAGVGPFALAIARLARPARVDAVDLNPAAVAYLKRNIERNKAAVVHAHHADARAYARAHAGAYDRVVMNLPHDAWRFFPDALAAVAPAGGVVHLHAILDPSRARELVDTVTAEAAAAGRSVAVATTREVRTYSSTERHLVFDLAIAFETKTKD